MDNMHKFGIAFRKLGNQEFQVFEYVYNCYSKKYHGTYSELGRAVNVSASSTRKAALRLVEIGVLGIYRDSFPNKTVLYVRVDWKDRLVESMESVKNPHEGIKRPRKSKAD